MHYTHAQVRRTLRAPRLPCIRVAATSLQR
jgi:hypothetical protein